MAEWVYKVVDDHGNTIADHMNLENAVILLKGLFSEYYNEPAISYSIERYSDAVEAVNEG